MNFLLRTLFISLITILIVVLGHWVASLFGIEYPDGAFVIAMMTGVVLNDVFRLLRSGLKRLYP